MADPASGRVRRAADLIGDLLASTGDVDGAEAAYRRATSLGHPGGPRSAPPTWPGCAPSGTSAGGRRADADRDRGRRARPPLRWPTTNWATCCGSAPAISDGGAAAYQQAIDSDHPDWSLVARFDLALLLYAQGDLSGAHEQLRLVIEGPNRGYAAKAWDLIGDLLSRSGDSTGARDAYRNAIDSDAPEWPAVARVDLANLILTETENVAEAEPLLTRTTARPDAAAASARLLLGLIALYRDDPDRAREEFQLAAERARPDGGGRADPDRENAGRWRAGRGVGHPRAHGRRIAGQRERSSCSPPPISAWSGCGRATSPRRCLCSSGRLRPVIRIPLGTPA